MRALRAMALAALLALASVTTAFAGDGGGMSLPERPDPYQIDQGLVLV